VPSHLVIQWPDARVDRFRPVQLAFIAVICLALGVAIGRCGTRERANAPDKYASHVSTKPRSSAPKTDPFTKRATPADGNSTRAISAEQLVKTSAPAGRKLEVSRVAYLRCDGLEQKRGDFPCPRDTALERAGWRILQEIATCQLADPGTGYADVRLDFRRGKRPTVRILLPRKQRPVLKRQALYDCVGKPLTSLTTALDPLYMVVSFQFWIRAG
jgi:hypothetical protein